jgi:hypothetical protein
MPRLRNRLWWGRQLITLAAEVYELRFLRRHPAPRGGEPLQPSLRKKSCMSSFSARSCCSSCSRMQSMSRPRGHLRAFPAIGHGQPWKGRLVFHGRRRGNGRAARRVVTRAQPRPPSGVAKPRLAHAETWLQSRRSRFPQTLTNAENVPRTRPKLETRTLAVGCRAPSTSRPCRSRPRCRRSDSSFGRSHKRDRRLRRNWLAVVCTSTRRRFLRSTRPACMRNTRRRCTCSRATRHSGGLLPRPSPAGSTDPCNPTDRRRMYRCCNRRTCSRRPCRWRSVVDRLSACIPIARPCTCTCCNRRRPASSTLPCRPAPGTR